MFAAMTQPRLTCQDFDGSPRSPMAFAVRTPPIPESGMFVQMMEYRHPVFFS